MYKFSQKILSYKNIICRVLQWRISLRKWRRMILNGSKTIFWWNMNFYKLNTITLWFSWGFYWNIFMGIHQKIKLWDFLLKTIFFKRLNWLHHVLRNFFKITCWWERIYFENSCTWLFSDVSFFWITMKC